MLSAQEKHTLIRLLGWPGRTLDSTSTAYNTIVTDRATNMTGEMEADVRGLLERIQELDEKLEKALCRAAVKEVDGVTLNSEQEIMLLRRERRRLLMELAELTEIPLVSRVGSAMGSVSV